MSKKQASSLATECFEPVAPHGNGSVERECVQPHALHAGHVASSSHVLFFDSIVVVFCFFLTFASFGTYFALSLLLLFPFLPLPFFPSQPFQAPQHALVVLLGIQLRELPFASCGLKSRFATSRSFPSPFPLPS